MIWKRRRGVLFEKEAVVTGFRCYNYFKKINMAKGFPLCNIFNSSE